MSGHYTKHKIAEMKDQIFKYISENNGVELIQIYDEFKDGNDVLDMCFNVVQLESSNEIKLIPGVGYVKNETI